MDKVHDHGEPADDVVGIAEAVVSLFRPHVEVVLHDLGTGRIVQLWNPLSGRRPGDESLIDPGFANTGPRGPYEQVDVRGHRTTSISVPIGDGRMLLCINFDRSALDGAAALLMSMGAARSPQPEALFVRDWRSRINETIADWCASRQVVARDLDKRLRRDLVTHLDQLDLFETRHAAEHVARALGISRATVYNLRKEISP